MGEILLHIGLPKTGTSALQEFLAINKNALINKGLLYDHFVEGNYGKAHYQLVQILLSDFNESRKNPLNNELFPNTKQFFDTINNSMLINNCKKSIISVETLGQLGPDLLFTHLKYDQDLIQSFEDFCIRAIVKTLTDLNLDFKVIFYVRRQDERIESWYNQILKDGFENLTKKKTDITAYFDEWKYWFDSYKQYEKWNKVIIKDNIIVRIYEKQQLTGDIVSDFFANVLKLSTENLTHPVKNIRTENTRLGRDVLEYKRIIDLLDVDSSNTSVTHMMHSISEDMGNRDNYKSFLSLSDRKMILDFYFQSNYNLAKEYFGREDGKLFYEELPEIVEENEHYAGLTVDKAIEISERLRAIERNSMLAMHNDYKMKSESQLELLLSEQQKIWNQIVHIVGEQQTIKELLANNISEHTTVEDYSISRKITKTFRKFFKSK